MKVKDRFLAYISVERRLSALTVETYAQTLKLFEDYLVTMPDPRTLETADGDNIRDWMGALMEHGRSAVYVNRQLAALRTFYKFCYANGIVSSDPAHSITGPKKEKRLPRFLKETEMDRLVEILDEGEHNFDNVRARTIIYMFYHTGLRSAELISLDDDMVDYVKREVKVTGKRNKQRLVPFGEELHKVLTEYISVRDANIVRQDNALFVSDKGGRLTYEQVRKIVSDNLSLVTNMKKKSPHVLRHTFATTMLNHDANLESIRKLLGHQSLNTTEIYTHTTFEQLKRIYDNAHPRKK